MAEKDIVEKHLEDYPELCPVTTLVLYFGLNRWSKRLSLEEDLVIPKELDPYVQN